MKKLLLAFLLLASPAFADTCQTSLMPAFTAAQAVALCTKLGTSVSTSIIPQTDNAIDLGSTSKTFRTLYTGTSIIAKTSQILRVRQDANRIFTFDGASDTALTFAIGDTTASQLGYIAMGTADASDTSILILSGGGGTTLDGTRGGGIGFYGNENAGAGKVDLVMGATGNLRVLGNSGAQAVLTVEGDADGGVVINTGRLDFGAAVSVLKPGATSFQINNNANSIANFKVVDAGAITIADTLVSTRTTDLGWSIVAGANVACNTTCTSACVFGINTAVSDDIVNCADATADRCLCAGPS